MKSIPTSIFERSHRSLTISIALLFVFVFVPAQAYAQIANTATGDHALFHDTTGDRNTADGYYALYYNTTGSYNTAEGSYALYSSTTASDNTAIGSFSLYYNTTGSNNTANGEQALLNNTTGSHNTANGVGALISNTTGSYNTAIGVQTLYRNSTGIDNTAEGNFALFKNTTGFNNTAIGLEALYGNTTGSSNIALGFAAGINLTTGSNNIDIGNYGVAGESYKIRIGTQGTQTATFIAGIRGVAVPNGVGVIVGASGKLGTVVSSARFKDEIKPMDKASEAILALKPVTFHYKHELDPDGIPQFGLVAEQVEKVNPDLVARDEEGKAYTVRYEAVNAMLLNEFLKAHRKVEEQDRKIAEQNNQAQGQKAAFTQLQSTVAKREAAIAQERNEIEMLTSNTAEAGIANSKDQRSPCQPRNFITCGRQQPAKTQVKGTLL
jgi:hypothetical protein